MALEQAQRGPMLPPDAALISAEAWTRIAPGVVMVDTGGRISGVSLAAQTLLAHPPSDLVGAPLCAVFSPDQGDRVGELLRRAAYAAAPPIRLSGREGRPLLVSAQPLGVPPGALVVLLAEAPADDGAPHPPELRTEEGRLRGQVTDLLSSSLDYQAALVSLARLVLPDLADWCIVDMVIEPGSDTRARMGLWPIHRLVVAHHDPTRAVLAERLARFPPDPMAAEGVGKVLRTGEPVLFPDINPTLIAAGTRGEEHARLVILLGCRSSLCVPLRARGKVLGALTFVRGDAGRAYTAEDLRLAEDLAGSAALAIDNARLYEESREATRAREAFLSIAAHELRGPLTPLQLQLQLLLRRLRKDPSAQTAPDAPPLLDAVQACERYVRRLSRLIQSLLEVSRITAGRLELAPEDLDLSQVAREVVARYASEATQVGSTVEVCLAGHCPGRWDRLRLEQVIGNLLSNAVKYGRGRPIQVAVTCFADPRGRRARLSVRDEGTGIAEAHLSRIFERFERGGAQRTVSGLGLGLYIVRQILDAMGGTVQVTSSLDVGSTFTVEFPCEGAVPT